MVQNHLMQLLCLVAMEAPVSFNADEIRDKKVAVLHALRPFSHDEVQSSTVRGQYGRGTIEGKRVRGYREEQDVAPDSHTESYAALKLFLDNWRWQDVPFYLPARGQTDGAAGDGDCRPLSPRAASLVSVRRGVGLAADPRDYVH